MPSLGKVRANTPTKRVAFEVDGEKFWVDLWAAELTTRNIVAVAGGAEDMALEEQLGLLSRMIADWNVLARDPEPGESEDDVERVPHDLESLLDTPGLSLILMPLMAAIAEEATDPVGEADSGSADGSSLTRRASTSSPRKGR